MSSTINKYHTLYFESTRNCNFSCIYCSSGSSEKKKHIDLPENIITEKILKPAKSLGTKFIDFSGGEFLIRKDWDILLEKAHQLGFIIGIASNGSLLNDSTLTEIKKIVGTNTIFSIGINAFDTSNKTTRDIETEFALKALELIQHYGFRANISITIGDFNKSSFSNTVKEIKKRYLPFNRIPFVPRNCTSYSLMFNKESLKKYFFPELIKHFNGQVSYTPYMLPQEVYESISGQDLTHDQIPLNPSVGCWVGAYYAINPEGEVSPCPMFLDHVSAGNVLEKPLKDILYHSELFNKITDRKNLEGRCGNCKYTYTCGGCRVMSYYYTGNVFAEDPTCFLSELSQKEIKSIEGKISKAFKNYARMAHFGKNFTPPKK